MMNLKNTNCQPNEGCPTTRRVLYMVGCVNLTQEQLQSMLQKYGINCVVDLRNEDEQSSLTGAQLAPLLKKQGAYYLSFAKEFGFIPHENKKSQNHIDYEKAVQSEVFLKGVKRLLNGLERGYHIALLDEVDDIADSYRLSVLSRYFQSQGIDVQPLVSEGLPLQYVASGTDIVSETDVTSEEAMSSHNALGKWGENIAAEYLRSKGYTIVERNWHYRHREIDIIAYESKTGTLCFVEVKTRRNDHFGDPEFAVNRKKMWFLVVAANHYIRSRAIDSNARFDVIAITGTPKTDYKIVHIPDAIPPSARATYR